MGVELTLDDDMFRCWISKGACYRTRTYRAEAGRDRRTAPRCLEQHGMIGAGTAHNSRGEIALGAPTARVSGLLRRGH